MCICWVFKCIGVARLVEQLIFFFGEINFEITGWLRCVWRVAA
jgi:hypothetical protein